MSKSTHRVGVALGEALTPVGEFLFETDGKRQTSLFRYAREWLDRADSFPLAPNLPLAEMRFHQSGSRLNQRSALPGPVSDGAPDAWGRGLIRKAQPGRLTELDYLLAVDDASRQGALRYLDEEGQPLARTYPPVPRLNELDDLRRMVAAAEGVELDSGLRDRLLGSAGSLGGGRPKASIREGQGALAVAKFTTAQDAMPIERMEVATLALARDAGLSAASARLELARTARPVAVIQRFDRTASGERIHYLSAQSFIGVTSGEEAYYTDIADMLRAHAVDVKAELGELYRRILFTILVSNNDDHLKNHGLLHRGGGRWSLSPAFDINPQPHRHRHLETGISELSGNAASIEAALEAAPFFEVGADDAASTLARMIGSIAERWRGHCRAAGMTGAEIKRYESAFDHEETRVARRLVREFGI
ncbi:MAG: type II toxin-antitoxin system HipA family toxin [Gammaproteobacteria bacterium]|nr:type II toxin-antitoxin system HipA family toxin [Gammaproteobacteria bacterium]